MEKEFEALKFIFGEALFSEYKNETHTKVRECNDVVFKALKELKDIKEAKPSEAMEILETLADDGLLNKEIGVISYNQIWLKMKIEVLKQALLKAQELEKENESLRDYIKSQQEDYDLLEYVANEKGERLRIIFEKGVDVVRLKFCNNLTEYYGEGYEKFIVNPLTKEEFEILKREWKAEVK